MLPRTAFGLLSPVVFAVALTGCPSRPDAQASGDAGSLPAVAPILTPDSGRGTADAAVADAGSPDATAPDVVMVLDAEVDGASDSDADSLPTTPGSELGVGCQADTECVSGSCVDGVCCASSSCGGCSSCGVSGSLGTCAPLPRFSEDPKSNCTDTNVCDGAGNCTLYNGNRCTGSSECASGFCVDGVCCESTCNHQCFSCNTVLQLRGKCQPLFAGTDEAASTTCDGDRSCAPSPGASAPACLLNNGESCQANADCASNQCSTYYADVDGDGYGDPTNTISRCDAGDAPPAGFVIAGGDCCDVDPAAHPGVSTYSQTPDVCASFDFDCDGTIEKQHFTGACQGYSGFGVPDCGQVCTAVAFAGSYPYTLYTQACH